MEFSEKRIENAVRFDLDGIKDTSTKLPHMLPTSQVMQNYVDKVGLSRSLDTILIYTHPGSFSAARVWWTFRAFGFNAVILQGGFKAWEAAGGAVTSGAPAVAEPQSKDQVVFNPKMVSTFDDVHAVIASGSILIDARSAGRFSGAENEPRPGLACGHIPGSVNLPFTEFFTSSDFSTFKSADEIKQLFTSRGVDINSTSTIISTCGSGVTACVLSFALQLCGRPPELCPVYDGSWAEWGSRTDTPKATL